jgi:hypothetical protein
MVAIARVLHVLLTAAGMRRERRLSANPDIPWPTSLKDRCNLPYISFESLKPYPAFSLFNGHDAGGACASMTNFPLPQAAFLARPKFYDAASLSSPAVSWPQARLHGAASATKERPP